MINGKKMVTAESLRRVVNSKIEAEANSMVKRILASMKEVASQGCFYQVFEMRDFALDGNDWLCSRVADRAFEMLRQLGYTVEVNGKDFTINFES